MTAPLLEELPQGIVPEQRSIDRLRPWEWWLFLATCAALLLLVCLLNHGPLSAFTGSTASHTPSPTAATASEASQQGTLSIDAAPVTPPSVESARDGTTRLTQRNAPVPSGEPMPVAPAPDSGPLQTPQVADISPAAGEPARTVAQKPRSTSQAPSDTADRNPAPQATPMTATAGPTNLPDSAPPTPTPPVAPSPNPTPAMPPRGASDVAAVATSASAGTTDAEPSSGTGPALYFASDIVLLSLLTQRDIEVYLKQGTQWSRVTLSGAAAIDLPDRPLYRLRADTVPDLLRRNVPSGSPPAASEWAVWLQSSIADAVQQSRRNAGDQDVVIDRGGRVQLRPSDPGQADSGTAGAGVPSG